MTRNLTLALLASVSMAVGACVEEQQPPEQELDDDAWDQVSPETRVRVLRAGLEHTLTELDYAVGAKRDRLVRDGVRQLGALRPELLGTEEGRAEYRALERRFEQLSGDAP